MLACCAVCVFINYCDILQFCHLFKSSGLFQSIYRGSRMVVTQFGDAEASQR